MKSFKFGFLVLLAAFGSAASAQHVMHPREGLTLASGLEDWKWTEFNEDGSTLLKETGGPIKTLAAAYTFSTHQDRVFHTVTLKAAMGEIAYEGAYIGGEAVSSTTKYNGLRFGYDVAAPLTDGPVALEWTAGLSYEKRDRRIWNPARKSYQAEDYQSGIGRLGVQIARPVHAGLYGGVGATVTLFTNMDPHATDIGFKSSPLLRPKADVGYFAKVGYAVSRNMAIELSHEMTRFKMSPKANIETTSGATGQIWQPASQLGRTSVQAIYKF